MLSTNWCYRVIYDLPLVIEELIINSERQGRLIDVDTLSSMEEKKQEGYFRCFQTKSKSHLKIPQKQEI